MAIGRTAATNGSTNRIYDRLTETDVGSMPEQQFDLFEYLGYLRRRWLFLAVACAIAAVVSAGISLTLPKQYRAPASILVDVSGAADPRASTCDSSVYMEYLRTYEHF